MKYPAVAIQRKVEPVHDVMFTSTTERRKPNRLQSSYWTASPYPYILVFYFIVKGKTEFFPNVKSSLLVLFTQPITQENDTKLLAELFN